MIGLYSKRGYEFSFAWIFAIFIGAAVIFFAIYFAIQMVSTQQASRNVAEGKSFGVLLTPVETGIEEGKFATMYLTDPTRVYFQCEQPLPDNPFGSQKLGLSIKPAIGEDWDEITPIFLTFHNKYFFPSAEPTQTENALMDEGEKEFYVLSKPLYLPFKVADLMIVYSDQKQFCFKNLNNAPTDFKRKIKQLNMTNVILDQPCDPTKQEIICFDIASSDCDTIVFPSQNKVTKKGEPDALYYLDSSPEQDKYAMLYPAIFSDTKTYQCQTKRLMAHLSFLIQAYGQKSQYISTLPGSFGCTQTAQPILNAYGAAVSSSAISGDLSQVKSYMADPNYVSFQRTAGGRCVLF